MDEKESPRVITIQDRYIIIGILIVIAFFVGIWNTGMWWNKVKRELAATPLFVEKSHRVPTQILNAPSGPTGELRFVVNLIEADVSGAFWLINRTTRVKQKITVAVGEKTRSLTVPVGEYAIYPDNEWNPKPIKCITHEGNQAYDTQCSWEESSPEILQVTEGGTTVVQPKLWIATAHQPVKPRSDRTLCGTHPVTFQNLGNPCSTYETCTHETSGYSFCKEGITYRKPISAK